MFVYLSPVLLLLSFALPLTLPLTLFRSLFLTLVCARNHKQLHEFNRATENFVSHMLLCTRGKKILSTHSLDTYYITEQFYPLSRMWHHGGCLCVCAAEKSICLWKNDREVVIRAAATDKTAKIRIEWHNGAAFHNNPIVAQKSEIIMSNQQGAHNVTVSFM